jgi:proteasome lid subunit RPN8/RPN11
MALQVSSEVLERMLAEARMAHPRECCGILTGKGAAIDDAHPARNVHAEPERHFEIDPQALIDAHRAARDGGRQVIGYFHSHPNGRAEPSATDRELAAGDGAVWAIIAAGGVRFFRSGAGGFAELPYEVTGS